MKLPRRQFLHFTAGATAFLTVSRIAGAQSFPVKPPSETRERPLAERLSAYANGLRYDDFDDATIERVKAHLIDTLGCGIAAFDEKPACRQSHLPRES
jgi:2-methylcitrate dehydratase